MSENNHTAIYIDTHCHLYDAEFYRDDADAVMQKIEETGVRYVLLASTGTSSLQEVLDFQKKYSHVARAMLGIHPEELHDDLEAQLDFIRKEVEAHEFVAIGEVGLDYYNAECDHEVQKNFFFGILQVAKERQLPVSVHVRDAFDDAIKILEKSQDGRLRGVIHCFTGDLEQAKQFIDLGFALGIGGIVTFKKSNLPEVLKEISLGNIVLETDSPYLAPVPFRGKRNDSSFLPFIVEKLTEIYDLSHEAIASATTFNAKKIFKLS